MAIPNLNRNSYCYESVEQDEQSSISEVDGILYPLDSPRMSHSGAFSLQRMSATSARLSISSMEYESLQVPPKSEDEAEKFLIDLATKFKKIFALKIAFERSCFADNFNDTSFSPNEGNTLLHLAVKIGDSHILNVLLSFAKTSNLDVNFANANGDTPLHKAVESKQRSVVEILIKAKPNIECFNKLGFSPVQIAALKLDESILQILIRQEGANRRIVTHQTKESLLHLACRAILMRRLNLKDEFRCIIEYDRDSQGIECERNDCVDFTFPSFREKESELMKCGFSLLKALLNNFTLCPELLELEDNIPTSPGFILHYFCLFNFQDGVNKLLNVPFMVSVNTENKNGLTPLWISAWSNNIECARLLLNKKANPNHPCSRNGFTPLHLAIQSYHKNRVKETCDFIDDLLLHGANPRVLNIAGETPAHLAVQTSNFQVISKFVDVLGPELLNLKEEGAESSNFFMYAVGRLDEKSIHKLIELGAPLMHKEIWGKSNEGKIRILSDSVLPLQEAVIGGNSMMYINFLVMLIFFSFVYHLLGTNYFNALLRCNLSDVKKDIDEDSFFVFLCCHLIAASRDLRSDVVRMIFQHVENFDFLHYLLLFKDVCCLDETFTKTALQWAVENNDRLCTTEILHQEFECHRFNKVAGLRCLRNQLKGDELLSWTIETFTVFYDRTLAQKCVIPFLALVPVFFSIFNFTYDYYSDISLTLQYYNESSLFKSNNKENESITEGICQDHSPTPNEYLVAFGTNVLCITSPLLVFLCMCITEVQCALRARRVGCWRFLGIFISIFCAPFFVLYVAGRRVYYQFRHASAKQKNKFRNQLRKSEYFWGITRSAEAGLESCGQLILQIWLLSFNFYGLSSLSFEKFIKKSLHGVVLILSFSINEADEIEQSLGKMFLSVISLVFSVSSGYRMLKRGSLRINNAVFVYLSTFFQVLARIFSLSLFFVGVRHFYPMVPLLLLCHFILVLILKITFEGSTHGSRSFSSIMVSLLTIFASSMVYVRIVPFSKNWQYEHKSTFVIQFLFFIVILVENSILFLTPIMFYDPEKTLLSCADQTRFRMYVLFILFLTLLSWICHIFYYKCLGHPWSDINGPGRDSAKGEFHFFFQFCGKDRVFVYNYKGLSKDRKMFFFKTANEIM